MKQSPNPEIVARLREMITHLALEEADALATYYRHDKDPNSETVLKNASRASSLFDHVTTAYAAYVVLGNDPGASLRARVTTTAHGVGMVRRLEELADEIDSVGRVLPSAVPEDDDHEDTIVDLLDVCVANIPTNDSGKNGAEHPLFV